MASSVKRKRSSSVSTSPDSTTKKATISKHELINALVNNQLIASAANPASNLDNNGGSTVGSSRLSRFDYKSDTIHEEPEDDESDNNSDDNNHDDDDDDDDEDDDDDQTQREKDASKQKSKRKKAKIDSSDIQIARETAELFKSNIFKMQIDELVKEVKLNESRIKVVEKFLHKLYDSIQDIKSSDKFNLVQASALFDKNTKHPKFQKITIPFADPKPTNINYKFQYAQPKDISLVGSFGLKTGVQLPFNNLVDLNVTIPNELFEKKDYLNYRAFHKRSFYLAYLTKELINSIGTELGFLKFHYEYVNGDLLTPSLRIDCTPADLANEYNFFKSKFSVRIITSFPVDAFDFKKLLPDRNSIRIQLPEVDTETGEAPQLPPTPIYNASLISNSTYDYYLKVLYKSKKQVEHFNDACILGRLWLLQRGFKSGSFAHGGFGHFEFALLMTLLLKGGGLDGNKILLSGFSSYQLFKGTIKYLATMDIADEGYLSFHSTTHDTIATHVKYISDGFQVPAIFDKATKLNILWKMSINSYQLLKHEAQITLNLLNNDVKDTFDCIFLKKNDISYLKYDLNVELPVPKYLNNEKSLESSHDENSSGVVFSPAEKITFISYENFIKNKLYTILKKGLQEKLKHVSIKIIDHCTNEAKHISGTRTTVHKRKPDINLSTSKIHIGLILNQQESEKLVIKGPLNTEAEEAEEFEQFWGDKASLRRFKDSSIHHCVIWEASANEPTIYQIIKYLFSLHLDSFVSSKIETSVTHFHEKLPLALLPSATKTSPVNVNSFNNFRASFENLYKVMMSLNDDLPLKIKSLMPASTSFRYTSTLIPVPFAVSNPQFFQDAVLEFETSKNWPDQIGALEDTKTAFLLKIHDLLSKSNAASEYRVFIAKDDQLIPYNNNITTLNILAPEGFGFKIRVLTERDEILYLRANANVTKDKRNVLEEIYLKFNQHYIGAVKHTRTVSTISHHFLFFSPVVRLFKRWLDDQFLLHHLNDQLVELIALKVFVDSDSWLPPSSVQNGFLRILYFLANWNWKQDPLVLDLTKKLDRELELSNGVGAGLDSNNEAFAKLSDRLTIQLYHTLTSNFDQVRKTDPNGVKTQYFIGSKDDNSGILWGNNVPLPIATRLTALSRVAINLLETRGLDSKSIDLLFKPALEDYDLVIMTKTGTPLKEFSGLISKTTYKNLTKLQDFSNLNNSTNADGNDKNNIDEICNKFDPVQEFVRQLNDKYSNVILFSTHKFGGLNEKGENTVTGIFYPNVLSSKSFKVNLGYNVKPADGSAKDMVVVNKEALLNEIAELGGDLVHNFYIKQRN